MIELNREIDTSTTIVGDFDTLLSTSARTTRKKINRGIAEQYINQQGPISIHKTFYPTITGYTFISSAQGMYVRMDHILGP